MTRYETITKLGDDFLILIQKGLIPLTMLDWKVYYESYQQQLEIQNKFFSKPKKHEALHLAASQYDISKRQMERIVSFMEGLT